MPSSGSQFCHAFEELQWWLSRDADRYKELRRSVTGEILSVLSIEERIGQLPERLASIIRSPTKPKSTVQFSRPAPQESDKLGGDDVDMLDTIIPIPSKYQCLSCAVCRLPAAFY